MRQGLHWADGPFRGHQVKGASTAYPDKLTVAEHSIDQGCRIQFHNSSILATKTGFMDRLVREAIETELHHYNINRENRFCLSKSWTPLVGSLKLSGHDPGPLGDGVPTLALTHALFTVNNLPLLRSYEISLCSRPI
jgi:hypothetical protein